MENEFSKDMQVVAMRGRATTWATSSSGSPSRTGSSTRRRARSSRCGSTSSPARRSAGCETDLSARVLRAGGEVFPGLYAAGEVAGFGGGGMHGYRSLEGTFLGGCIFSGRVAGRAAAAAL